MMTTDQQVDRQESSVSDNEALHFKGAIVSHNSAASMTLKRCI